MRKTALRVFGIIASRRVTPLIIAVFVALYAGIAFYSDEALAALMGLTRGSVLLMLLLALIPLNIAARLLLETAAHMRRRLALRGRLGGAPAELFEEEVLLPKGERGGDPGAFLRSCGYKVVKEGRTLGAWRGYSAFPARFLFLLGIFCLFSGIALSLTTRSVAREGLIEGEPLPSFLGAEGGVERITMEELGRGAILTRDLSLQVATPSGRMSFGLYPPGRLNGFFVYPRYLGVAPLVRFSGPGVPPGLESYFTLSIYPPGREDSVEIPGTPYKVFIALVQPPSGEDPYVTGRFVFTFRVARGEERLLEGSAPVGGAFSKNGYTIAFPDARKMVLTDFIRDPGVPLIWLAALLLTASIVIYLPVRLLNPRREMVLVFGEKAVDALARSEGRMRGHVGVFHEILDMVGQGKGDEP